jgi:hypothetical protein
MPSSSNILERLRWKIALGLVIVASGFAANAAPSADVSGDQARSSWGFSRSVEADDEAVDVARSSWGFSRSVEADDEAVDVARSSWGFSRSAEAEDEVDAA